MTIEFKPIPGFEGYFISRAGLIISKRKLKGHCMSFVRHYKHSTGCWGVDLNNKKCKVHRLVAITYLANPENKPQVNHINGDRLDNRLENLEWVTASQNLLHSTQVLKQPRGFHASSKMLKVKPLIIRDLKSGIKQSVIAIKYKVGQSVVSRINNDPRKKHYKPSERTLL